jgi:hypothetical protein
LPEIFVSFNATCKAADSRMVHPPLKCPLCYDQHFLCPLSSDVAAACYRLSIAQQIFSTCYNGSIPTVPCRYRARLEAVLPEIFVSFNATYKAADSRMVQEALKRAVLRLLRVWRERFIFNDDYINGLQVRLFTCTLDQSI